MQHSTQDILCAELEAIVHKHLHELKVYHLSDAAAEVRVPPEIVRALYHLSTLCATTAPQTAGDDQYRAACVCLGSVQRFLRTMNQPLDATLVDTQIYRIIQDARSWCKLVEATTSDFALNEVWDFIDPVKPDHLDKIDAGVFEARWWKPVPMMDVEILARTERVVVHHEVASPQELPGGMVVRFSIMGQA